jgi:hypothetical protein
MGEAHRYRISSFQDLTANLCGCAVPGWSARLGHLAQQYFIYKPMWNLRRIYIKVGNKKQFLAVKYLKNGGFCMKKGWYFKQEKLCKRGECDKDK